MKIKKGKRSGLVVTLGRDETRLWKSATPDAYKLKERTRKEARKYAQQHDVHGKAAVYASTSDGGWQADEIDI